MQHWWRDAPGQDTAGWSPRIGLLRFRGGSQQTWGEREGDCCACRANAFDSWLLSTQYADACALAYHLWRNVPKRCEELSSDV